MPSAQELQLEYAQRDISFQYAQLCLPANCPPGIYVQLDDDDTHLWHAVLFVHSGPFRGGVFRFDIVFPKTYPLATPQVFFPPTLLHPLVEPVSGRLALGTLFKTAWNPRKDFVSHILAFVRSVFDQDTLDHLSPSTVVNTEVFRMYQTQRGLFNKLALQSVALSTAPSSLYDVSGGSGFPNTSVPPTKAHRAEAANGIIFRDLPADELAALRADIFGPMSE